MTDIQILIIALSVAYLAFAAYAVRVTLVWRYLMLGVNEKRRKHFEYKCLHDELKKTPINTPRFKELLKKMTDIRSEIK